MVSFGFLYSFSPCQSSFDTICSLCLLYSMMFFYFLTAKLYHAQLLQHCAAVHVVPESLSASDAACVSYIACDCAKTGKGPCMLHQRLRLRVHDVQLSCLLFGFGWKRHIISHCSPQSLPQHSVLD
ncbi:hypothetical protein ABZP36_023224 [Zizania latifolia]